MWIQIDVVVTVVAVVVVVAKALLEKYLIPNKLSSIVNDSFILISKLREPLFLTTFTESLLSTTRACVKLYLELFRLRKIVIFTIYNPVQSPGAYN